MLFQNSTVRFKLISSFTALAFAVLAIAIFSLQALSSANQRFVAHIEGISARSIMAEQVRTAVDRRAIAARNMVLAESPSEVGSEFAAVSAAHADVQQRLAKLNEMIKSDTSDRSRSLVAQMNKVEGLYGPVALNIVSMARNGQKAEAIAKINIECKPLLAQLIAAAEAYAKFTEDGAQASISDAQDQYNAQRSFLLLVCVSSFIAAGLAGFLITRSLSRALGAEPAVLGRAAHQIAAGDLHPIFGAESAPTGSVLASLGAMQNNLASIVQDVRSASDAIAHGSADIATGNADLRLRTESQAHALQDTASTMEELGVTVHHNAENARNANGLATSASTVAAAGGKVVGEVVTTMRSINDSSRKIADIVGVIDAIAFQTNILALNAAVEAARAGEHGRGFAVVASEVRSLAARSAASAREIKALIETSVNQVEEGTALVEKAGSTMQEIVTSIQRVSDMVSEISAASAQQSAGVNQVGQAVAQMDHVTQQNNALVDQSAAAAENLKLQAEGLVQAVGAFQLDSGAVKASTPGQIQVWGARPARGKSALTLATAG